MNAQAAEQQYLAQLRTVLTEGGWREDRTGVGTRSVFGIQMRFQLGDCFPLLTTKRVHFKSIVLELLWFLQGSTNVRWLQEQGVSIWDEWADQDGELGPIYGKQWRRWRTADGREIDQISQVVESISKDPSSRRHIVVAWNPGEIESMALAPCHTLFQFYVSGGALSCTLYQRSGDMFLGVPFNIASYALLTHMIAKVVGLRPGNLIHTIGDAHIYENHVDQVNEQLARKTRDAPRLAIKDGVTSIFDFQYSDFELIGYNPQSTISAPVAV